MSDPSEPTFSEDVLSNPTEWDSASQNLTLLVEINEFVETHDSDKIDWNAVAENTSGISNARECQMILRHLAYGAPFLENMEDGAEPLDDDSDLETGTKLDPPSSSEELAKDKEIAEILPTSASEPDTMTEKVQNEKKATAEDEENMTNADKKQASLDAAAATAAISSVNEKDEVFASSSLSEDLGNKIPSGSSSETNSSSESDHNEQSKYRSSQNLTLLDAREYQMIWRHLVNGNSLLENIEDGAEPLDDDSDLETEPYLEAFERAKERLKIFLSSGLATSITERDQMEKKATEEDHDNMTDTGSRSLVNEESHVVASLANEGPGEHCKGDLKGVENKASSSVAAASKDEIVASSSLSEDGEDKAPACSSSETVMIDIAAGSETDPREETKEEEKESTD